ncbi:MAG: glycosyltransferase [Actinomycetota bacterium]|nr:glycosyltransferase [Actinomycetota bacterium]
MSMGIHGPAVPLASDLPLVSVVVATRDRPELLRRALLSILGQDYKGEVECLVVFDQSPPDESLVESGEGRVVRVLANDRTPGLAGARNAGAARARGDLLAFCDDDDEWLQGKLPLQVEALQHHPEAGVVVSGVEIDYQGRILARIPAETVIDRRQLLRSRVMEAHPSSFLVRRHQFFGEIGQVDEHLPGSYGEDYDWLLRASEATKVIAVRQALVRVLWHPSSWFARRWETIIEACTYLLAKHPGFGDEPLGLGLLYGKIAFAHAALKHRALACRWAVRTLAVNPREKRAYLALLVASGILRADAIVRFANSRGRGI